MKTQKHKQKSDIGQRLKRSLLSAVAAGGALAVASGCAPFIADSSAGYSDSVFMEVEGVSVPPTTAIAAVVPSYALDTMQVLDVAGNLWIWGYYGNSGPGTSSAAQGGGKHGIDYSTGVAFNEHKPNQFVALGDIKSMASSAYANYAVDSEGNLFGWGQNNGGLYMFGEKFNGPGKIVPEGTTPENATTHWADGIFDTDVTGVATVEYGAAYTKKDGTIWTVGDNNFAQRGQGTSGNGATALQVSTQVTKWPGDEQPNIKTVASGYEGYYAVDDEQNVYFWGRSFRNGAGTTNKALTDAGCRTVSTVYSDFYCATPVLIPEVTAIAKAEGITSIGGGYSHGHLVTAKGNLYSWGSEENNYSGNDALADNSANGTLPTLKSDSVIAASGRFGSTQFITEDGTVWAYGNNLWGGAFSLNVPARTPVNTQHKTGKIWDPSADENGRKAILIGGNKDSASLVLDDGTILSWGENGGGAACGGYTYGGCKDADGNNASVTAGGAVNGLYVWPPAKISGIQNVGRYQTSSLNSQPFTGSSVLSGEQISYNLVTRNTFADPANYTVGLDISAFIDDVDVVDGTALIRVGDEEAIEGAVVDGKIEWSGVVPGRSQVLVELTVVVKQGTPGGAKLVATSYLKSDEGRSDADSVAHITTTNPEDLDNCDSCLAP